MSDEATAANHPLLAEHASQLDPGYGLLFDNLSDPRLRAEAARLIDFLTGEQIAVPAGLAPELIPVLRAAVEAAHPDRKCLELVAARFPAWAAMVEGEASRAAFFEGLPALGPALADLGEEGMGRVIAAVNRDPRLMAAIGSYALTTKEIVTAMARLAASPAVTVEVVQRLVGAVTMAKMEESKDVERLVPAMTPFPDALPALVTLAEKNPSSAYGATKGLAAALKTVGDGARSTYLADFRLLAETVGLSSVGFVLDTLPKMYVKQQATARAFVALAAECAREYGQRAGQAFLERKTAAAKRAAAEGF